MGMARLNVWITKPGQPCTVDSGNWQVFVLTCDLKPLKWCKFPPRTPAKCGHADIELPPGCYVVIAVGDGAITCPAVVEACCDHHTCVKLFALQRTTRLAEFDHILKDRAET